MSLLTEAEALASRPGGTCGVARLVSRLSELERAEVEELIWAKGPDGGFRVSSNSVSKTLELHEWEVNDQTITRHRGGKCKCPR